ncbi:CHAT domain-containing protein [Microdochium trichocladiopsis]|uniref:CHAT domain-containing protein n=1 Tax=Microdochium trichocladiopsis TaxID=1682393 RepID=A0A9P9BQY1_9PEZI|nr:CHAT domain-containing protein [Microdochium trichocladiopsis]KAH7031398.1 CHAT domain-containing protein [Microdochium trichocladiopsis]
MASPGYRGVYTSLYASLSPQAIQDIEQVIWCRLVGQFDVGRKILLNELDAFSASPVVIIEHGDLEIEAGRWGEAYRVLDAGLKTLEKLEQQSETAARRLIALTRAMVGIRHRGDAESAIIEIERTMQWLGDVPVAAYSDIQASCVRRYVILYLFAKLSAKYENAEAEHIPLYNAQNQESQQSTPWAGLRQLQQSLCDRGMFNEANALFRQTLNRTPLENREIVVEEFLASIGNMPATTLKRYFEAVVRLQWAGTYFLLQKRDRAIEEMEKSAAAFNAFCDQFEVADRDAAPHVHAWAYELLAAVQDPTERLDRTEALAAELKRLGSGKLGMCLSAAADLSWAFYNYTKDKAYRERFFAFQAQLEEYDTNVSEDLCDLILHRNTLISATVSTMVDRQNSLEWIDGFLQKHVYFTAPTELASLYRNKALVLQTLRRTAEAKKADAVADRLDSPEHVQGRKWMHLGYLGTADPANTGADPDRDDFEDEDLEGPFFAPWIKTLGDPSRTAKVLCSLLRDWLLEDITSQRISEEEWKIIAGEAELSSVIFDTSSPRPLPALEQRYASLCKWLANPPLGQRKRRLLALMELRDARQQTFAKGRLWDQQIAELTELLNLCETLPRQISIIFPHSRGSYLGALALAQMAKLESQLDLTTAASFEVVLREAEASSSRALDEFRRTNNLAQIAVQQRNAARICLWQILKLHRLGQKSELTTESRQDEASRLSAINELREVGMQRIEEANHIFTQSELHASRSDGLEAVNNRHALVTSNASFQTIQVAIALLLAEPGGPSERTITQVWTWVQKYKARSLARTIGARASDPPGLVSEIMAFPGSKALYEEMGRLQNQIDMAEQHERFELRRKMEHHRGLMKRDPLLRRVIDLREGNPFDGSELAVINKETGEDVVLVDWMYHYSTFADAPGQFLLFTARCGSAPDMEFRTTMDVLKTKAEDIAAWERTFLNPAEWKDIPEENLASLKARIDLDHLLGELVAPLAQRTRPKDFLVLCPSTALHRIPIHALSIRDKDPREADMVDEKTLSQRNSLVYIHSHSLLRSCFAATQFVHHLPVNRSALKPLFVSGIPVTELPDAGKPESGRFSAGRGRIRGLAEQFKTKPMIDDDGSKESLMESIPHSRLLHVHTHCQWKSSDPLDHHLELARPHDLVKPGESPVEQLAAREVLGIRLSTATHVNMIACQGGVTEVKPGDEVMGLVPAFLHSGASSTVSTLWRISDVHGAEFSRSFFNSFIKQLKAKPSAKVGDDSTTGTASTSFVNMAKAMRHAIRELDPDNQQPLYKWAGFVLHGFWEFPVSDEDRAWIQKLKAVKERRNI